jgi:hypothetical protein
LLLGNSELPNKGIPKEIRVILRIETFFARYAYFATHHQLSSILKARLVIRNYRLPELEIFLNRSAFQFPNVLRKGNDLQTDVRTGELDSIPPDTMFLLNDPEAVFFHFLAFVFVHCKAIGHADCCRTEILTFRGIGNLVPILGHIRIYSSAYQKFRPTV